MIFDRFKGVLPLFLISDPKEGPFLFPNRQFYNAKVVLDQDTRRLDVVVPDDQLSLAIGRRGQNVRLATQLIGWSIDIMTEAEESERRQNEFKTRSALFIEALDVDEVIAHLLVVEGFTSVQDIVDTSDEELGKIEGFDLDVAAELKSRAASFLAQKKDAFDKRCKELAVEDESLPAVATRDRHTAVSSSADIEPRASKVESYSPRSFRTKNESSVKAK
jgi:transcription termination factor NusA